MKPAAFDYHAPHSLDETLELLARHGETGRVLAGGQSLVPMMNARIARPDYVIDINGLDALHFIREAPGMVEIGALVRHREIQQAPLLEQRCPILPAVAATIGHVAIRERGTIGGSLALADPAAQWPLLAMLLNGRIDLASTERQRSVEARDFFAGVFTTTVEPGELLTAVAFPQRDAGEGWGYRAFCRRHGDFAIAAAAATVTLDTAGNIGRLRLAVGGIGGVPASLDPLTAAWCGRKLNDIAMAAIGEQAAAACEPGDDLQATAEFRRELVAVLTAQALADALDRTRERTP